MQYSFFVVTLVVEIVDAMGLHIALDIVPATTPLRVSECTSATRATGRRAPTTHSPALMQGLMVWPTSTLGDGPRGGAPELHHQIIRMRSDAMLFVMRLGGLAKSI